MFPEKNDRFTVENVTHKGAGRENGYQGLVFECTFKDDDHMVAKVVNSNKKSWFKVGTVVDFSSMTYECILASCGYLNALNNVPGNGFGFVRSGMLPKLVLSPDGTKLIEENNLTVIHCESPEFADFVSKKDKKRFMEDVKNLEILILLVLLRKIILTKTLLIKS